MVLTYLGLLQIQRNIISEVAAAVTPLYFEGLTQMAGWTMHKDIDEKFTRYNL